MSMIKKLLLSAFLTLTTLAYSAQPIKIACVGDSITFGSRIPEPDKLSYPSQLQNLLGENYEVHNFGRSGATLLKKGNMPYWNCPQLNQALELKPNIVFIKLGTNDSKKNNWAHKADFISNYKELINKFKNCGSKPRIVILQPLPAFIDGDQISGSRIKNEIIPKLKKIAFEEKLEIIDLHSLMIDKSNWLPDKIHPNAFGAHAIAWRLYELLSTQTYSKSKTGSYLKSSKIKYKVTNFHGYPCYEFVYNNRLCKIVAPKKPAIRVPWVWRARFWGHEPQFDISMLERGYHIAYCDVAGYFGNFEAIAMWNKFYELAIELNLEKKMILEGMSRGGLPIYNWASLHPEKVVAIYGDAPVCDFRSWPGGLGKGPGSPRDYKECLKKYRIDSLAAETYKKMPIDRLAPLAKANIPLINVCGLSDKIVPFEENTAILAKRYNELGGKIKVIKKPSIGHHPHSLENPYPITRFVLRAAGRWISDAVVPAPSAEFRGGSAGWGGGIWWNQHENINKLVKENAGKVDIVFLGDSITQSWTGPHQRMAQKDGDRAFDKNFGMYKTICMGISGDRTEHLLYRIDNGNLDDITPKVVVLMIGVNNLLSGEDSPEEIAAGISIIINKIQRKLPNAHIIINGTFPTAAHPHDEKRLAIDRIHELTVTLSRDKLVHYIDLRKKLLKPNGTLNYDFYSNDNIHLKGAGYNLWANEIKIMIDDIMSL